MPIDDYTRRDLFKLIGGALGLGSLAFPPALSAQVSDWRLRPEQKSVEAAIADSHKPGRRSPNVIILMADQLPVFMCGCYGHRSAQTATIDPLAAGSAVFDAAYCPSPICAPSRAELEEKRYQSEERRTAIRKVGQKLDWQKESIPVPQPSRD